MSSSPSPPSLSSSSSAAQSSLLPVAGQYVCATVGDNKEDILTIVQVQRVEEHTGQVVVGDLVDADLMYTLDGRRCIYALQGQGAGSRRLKKGAHVMALYTESAAFAPGSWTTVYYPAMFVSKLKSGIKIRWLDGSEKVVVMPSEAQLNATLTVPSIITKALFADVASHQSSNKRKRDAESADGADEEDTGSHSQLLTLANSSAATLASASSSPGGRKHPKGDPWEVRIDMDRIREDELLPLVTAQQTKGQVVDPSEQYRSALGIVHHWDQKLHLQEQGTVVAPYVLRW